MSTTTAPETMAAFLEKHGKKPASYAAVTGALDAMKTVTIEALKRHKAAIAALEARITELEARPAVKYAGIWRSDQAYAEGHLTTHKGGLWLAVHTTNLEPGTEASGFKLIVKSGGAR